MHVYTKKRSYTKRHLNFAKLKVKKKFFECYYNISFAYFINLLAKFVYQLYTWII